MEEATSAAKDLNAGGSHPVHYMDIPPSLKEQALKKGFSLFEDSATAGAPLSALERAADQGFNLPLFHKTNKEFTEFKPNSHFGTTDQANMRAVGGGASIMPVMVRGENFRRMRDTGDWSEKKLKPLAGKHDGVVYLNRYEGIPQESFHRAAAEVGGFEKLDLLSDAQFKKLIPEAQDSYIVFDPKNVRSKFANFDPEAKNKSGLLLEDAAAPGAPLSALEHPGASYHALLDQPTGGAYKPTHAPEAAPAEAAAAPSAPRGNGPGGAGGGDAGLHEAAAAAARRAGARAPLEGLPTKALKIGDEHFVPGPIDAVHKVAEQYLAGRETPSYHKPPTKYHPLDEEHSRAIARAFDEMKHTPDDPATRASYDALIKETADQYQAIKKSGLKIEAITPDMPDPYAANPRLAAKDVADNNHLWYFPTDAGFGSNPAAGIDMATHPMMRKTGERLGGRELLANDMFRIVHDYFGHLKEGYGFRAAGEDNAWRSHASMYSDLARPAMTTETRGQNSWVNYGPHGESNRTASAADTKYADQKVGLMPEWTMRDRGSPEPTIAYHAGPYSFDKFDPNKIGTGEGAQAYGHGLYFAGHEPVSEWYRHQLSARRDPILPKHGLDAEDGANVGMRLAATNGDAAPVIADLEKEIASLRSDGDTSKGTQNMIVRRRGMVSYLKDPERNRGHMYQVAIDHPPDHFLDWDKPLSEQSQHVRDVYKSLKGALDPQEAETKVRALQEKMEALAADRDPVTNSMRDERQWHRLARERDAAWEDWNAAQSGAKFYESMGRKAPNATDAIHRAGIPGIKYLDQGSRSKGGGTSNYVTFSAPRILKKYGVPGLIGAGGFGSIAGDER
jgi:hypothetical protein